MGLGDERGDGGYRPSSAPLYPVGGTGPGGEYTEADREQAKARMVRTGENEQSSRYVLVGVEPADIEARIQTALKEQAERHREIRHRAWLEGYEACKTGQQMHSPYAKEHHT